MKKERDLAAQSETFGDAKQRDDEDSNRRTGNQFLKMFKFEKTTKDDSSSAFNDSCDYASYLMDVQESKAELLKELKETGKTTPIKPVTTVVEEAKVEVKV